MADIFISYASEDRSRVEPLAKALEDQGWPVFWDRAIPGGETWDEVIEKELDAAKCVVVVWSKISIKSRWVRAEAEEGLHRNILVPVSIEDVKIPLLFRPIQSVHLIKWQQDSNHPQFKKLISDLRPILGPSPLNVKEAEQLRAEGEKRRKEQEEQERKAAGEKRHKGQESKRKTEEERLKKEKEAKRKADEEQKRRDSVAMAKNGKPEHDAKETIKSVSSESRKTGKTLKFGTAGVVIMLLIVGIWWYILKPQQYITNSIGMKFVLIPAGSFNMGSQLSPEEVVDRYGDKAVRSELFKDEHPPHPVKIKKPFYLQTTEVSQVHWKVVMKDNPSNFKNCGDDCPVENVSWSDAQEFIRKLNELEGTNKYRLPTEAEWEYACRAETMTPFFTGQCISTDQANYKGTSPGENCPKGEWREKTVKVGSFQPNSWGLYDMHGNVYEWCQDWYGEYPTSPVIDPKGPDKGERRVMRGGTYYDVARDIRSAYRHHGHPGARDKGIGFRVARDF